MKQENNSKKFPFVSWIVLILLVGASVTAYIFSPQLFGAESVFHRVVSRHHIVQTLFMKIPLLIRSVQVVTVAVVLKLVLDFLLSRSLSRSKRGVTVMKLLSSFLKWIVGIVSLLVILGIWGVNTAAIIASAGILSLVVGLGAQSLVADIIAGLFIVIEGEYQVDDIVVIDNWRGTVTEIGIRTTKIQDAGGNIKIINNSEITTIINQTQALSVARVVMSIEYSESLPRVELILRDHLEPMKERIGGILAGPFYKGVTALSASSVDLLFLANCREEDIYQVQRDLTRELKLLFDEHQINIPFSQVVVHAPLESTKKTTKKMKDTAQEFVEAQKESSKGVEERPQE